MKTLALKILVLYKKYMSPTLVSIFGHSCRFSPSCSEYAHEAISNFGILKGGILSLWRIAKCNPFTKTGYDPLVKPA